MKRKFKFVAWGICSGETKENFYQIGEFIRTACFEIGQMLGVIMNLTPERTECTFHSR